jgi:hypothetical protein
MQIAQRPLPACRRSSPFSFAALFIVFGLMAASAHAASGSYEDQRKACLSGQTNEAKEVCLREAAAARGEAKRGNLTDTPDRYRQNALARCNVLPQADREDCARRVDGNGTVSGSVEDGGIYRESRRIVPEPASPPAGSPSGDTMPMTAPPSGMQNRY